MNIQTSFRAKNFNIHSRCDIAKNGNSLRSDSTDFAHSTSFVHKKLVFVTQSFGFDLENP